MNKGFPPLGEGHNVSKEKEHSLQFANYCVSFIDLLGQRKALEGEGILRTFGNDCDRQEYVGKLRNKVAPIVKLQSRATAIMEHMQRSVENSARRNALSPTEKALWDAMMFTRVSKQHWSDGFVSFVCLADRDVKCVMNGVFSVLASAGSICLMALAEKHPVRGSVEIAWGIELKPQELYGAVIARAYELESEVAQYPRIVVGKEAMTFLTALKNGIARDEFSRVNQALAELCLSFLIEDRDGHYMIHYLGLEFQNAASAATHEPLYGMAREFVDSEYARHRGAGDTKLALRYAALVDYFEAFPLADNKTSSGQSGTEK